MTNVYQEYLLNKVNREVEENEIFVVKIYKELFNKPYNLKSLNEKELGELYKKVKYEKNILDSPLTLEKVNAILLAGEVSYGGGALCAFTSYICKNCNEENMWHNSNVPKTCDTCRDKKAMNIIQSGILNVLHVEIKENKA